MWSRIPRRKFAQIKAALADNAAVAILGPRQVGKTTIAQDLAESTALNVYLDLEFTEDRRRLQEPAEFLRSFENYLVVLDEIHWMPEIFRNLRGLIDQGRRRGRRAGRFLILGSASLDLLQQSSESLAGRIAYIDLDPLDVTEIEAAGTRDLWLRGGFPESFLAKGEKQSVMWRQHFIRSYLERDIPAFGPRIPASALEQLWTMLAHNQGTLLNASRLATSLMLSAQTVTRYIDLLEDLLLVRRLRPVQGNEGKRMVKSPKTYVRDSGLVHSLLRIDDFQELSGHPVVGPSWEGFVIENLITASPARTIPGFYRTAAGAEIDLVLQIPSEGTWAIEVKRSAAPKLDRGFHHACEDLKPEKRFVVHGGMDRHPMANGVEAIGVRELTSMLIALNK